jgi:hypothetical protein
MSYATPFYYAAKALHNDSFEHASQPRRMKERRRRIRRRATPALAPGSDTSR